CDCHSSDLHSFPTRRSSDLIHSMITVLGSKRRFCDGITRRETLQVGALSLFGGLTLENLLRAERSRRAKQRPGKAKSVILLFLRSEEHTSELQSLAYLVCRL